MCLFFHIEISTRFLLSISPREVMCGLVAVQNYHNLPHQLLLHVLFESWQFRDLYDTCSVHACLLLLSGTLYCTMRVCLAGLHHLIK